MADNRDQDSGDVDAATVEQVEAHAGGSQDEEVEELEEEAPAPTIEVSIGVQESSRTPTQQEETTTTEREENKELKQEGVAEEERFSETKECDDDERQDKATPATDQVMIDERQGTATPATDQDVDPIEGEADLQLPTSTEPEDDGVPYSEPYSMSEQLTVSVDVDGEIKTITVQIVKATARKPFIGGYRHKITGVEYHHAATMTIPKRRPDDGKVRFERETQTVVTRNKTQQTTSPTSTQMTKTGCYVSSQQDKVIIPGVYETADEFHAKRLQAVIILQSHYRRWHAETLVNGMKQDRIKRQQWEHEEELRKELERQQRLRRDFERRMNPKTKRDFDMLYHALEVWRQQELSRINAELSGVERKAALCQLLEHEAELIASIGRHKIVADKDRTELQTKHLLDAAASPRKWIAFDGKMTEMDTPFTVRANELRELYQSLNMKYLTQEERMDVLLTLKVTVQEHDCKLTREIVELIERETELLLRGTKQKSLEGLRKRISNLFLEYSKTPMFNPEVSRLLKVPQQPTQLIHDVYFCRSTGQYLPSTEFELSTNARTMGTSRKAAHVDNVGRKREDDSVYSAMLNQIRRSEEKYHDNSRVVFLIQEADLRHLVERIWAGQSLLSQHSDLNDLIMVRWDVCHHWSPWNCVLLSKDEALGHFKLESLEEAYSESFFQKVKYKHVMARNYFRRLAHTAEFVRHSETEEMDQETEVTIRSNVADKQAAQAVA